MSRRVYRRPQVDADLLEIARFIAADRSSAAIRFLDAAETTFTQLAESPEIGPLGEFHSRHLRGVRRWRVKGFTTYLIFYRELPQGVEIIRVLHGARDIDNLFVDES